MTRFRSVWSLC